MRTRCPHCHTTYDVDPQILQQSQGLARCYRCTQVFNASQNALDAPAPTAPVVAKPHPLDESDTSFLAEDETQEAATIPAFGSDDTLRTIPPTSDLAPGKKEPQIHTLPEASPPIAETWTDPAATTTDTAVEKELLAPAPPRRTPWWQKLLVAVLSLTLLAQLAWLRRDLWIDLPQATQLCSILDCEFADRFRPQDFTVVERNMEAEAGPPAALHLWLAIRNDAPFAQPLPRLQLTLQDSTGALVARRLFTPEQYLPLDWTGPPAALPGEVIAIELRLKDPGPRAQGFVIDFL